MSGFTSANWPCVALAPNRRVGSANRLLVRPCTTGAAATLQSGARSRMILERCTRPSAAALGPHCNTSRPRALGFGADMRYRRAVFSGDAMKRAARGGPWARLGRVQGSYGTRNCESGDEALPAQTSGR